MVRERYDESNVTAHMLGSGSDKEMEYHGAFFFTGMTTVVRMWLQNGCREEPEELYDLIRRQGAVQEAMIGW